VTRARVLYSSTNPKITSVVIFGRESSIECLGFSSTGMCRGMCSKS
jgi:hypothetical protein